MLFNLHNDLRVKSVFFGIQCLIQTDQGTEEMRPDLRVVDNEENSDVETELFIGPPEVRRTKQRWSK